MASSQPAAGSNSQKRFWGRCSLRRALGGPCRKARGRRGRRRRLGLEGAQVHQWGPSWRCQHPPTPPLACLISHQASAGPGRTPSPKPLWPLWPRGRAPPPLPPPHPLLGPPWPPALHSPQVGARAQRQPPPRPIRAESLPLSVCSAGGRGVSPGEGRGLALSAEDAGTPQPPECEAEGPPGRLDPPVPRPQPGLPSSSGMFFLLPLQGTAQGTETSTAKRTG